VRPLTPAEEAFLREGQLAVLTTLRADGSPHSTVLWIDADGGEILINTARGRAKERHVLADPRVSIAVYDRADFQRWLIADGTATLGDEGAAAHIDALADRYDGPRAERISLRGEQRVILRIAPVRVETQGL
jgi:PPOX class probable F420-dependent enzyme